MKKAFRVKGTHCRACKALIEDVCGDILGVKRCTVDFGTGNMVVEYEGKPDWNALKKEIESLGKYTVEEA
ncbi:TPA: heavy-metal-associated domain-containing protein [Candidatus Woesearchaeota archaeon]|nr:MAG: hypothetical protein QT04_C0002G0013 [archaeon GW2011_AR11]QBM01069.1 hypothetical protein [uncultured archaeon]HIH05344.1 heavy-metal-associated domain-containing protein [Candidatus Woesearchaeota archaeon]QBM01142.1 hypothetical protein [uncultured archaeon]HIH91766.1 heavy-metal-associated domain-containing protein [Candidatus Woesearchaeota archaeon]